MNNYKHLKIDLSNCDSEPIHIIGRIQAHGFLIIFHPVTYRIEQVSANIETLCEFSAKQVLNTTLTEIFPKETSSLILSKLEQQSFVAPFSIRLKEQPYICFLSNQSSSIHLEVESLPHRGMEELQELQTYLAEAVAALSQQETIEELSSFMATCLQRFLAYDRVMIYQFDQDYNGNVIAEWVKEGVKSYHNHHFPASDIPSQAREMLLRTGIRQIPDVGAEGIDLIPYFHPATGQPSDIGNSVLRNPSKIHVEYLKNMKVEASLSIAIIVRSKLWGLVCCHHQTPVFIDFFRRNIAQLITSYYAKALQSAKETKSQASAVRYKEVEKKLLKQMEQNLSLKEGLFEKELTILDLSTASGAALAVEDNILTLGECPQRHEIEQIIEWAAAQELPSVFCTREFIKYYPAAMAFKGVASGVMLIEVSKHSKDYILCFKPQITETISWAGNPDKSLEMDDQKKLHPRKSFEKWEQQIEGKSAPWSALEEERANSLAKSAVSIQLRCQAEKLKKLNEKLEVTLSELKNKNEQLEDFTRIASHNLLSPLNTIGALIQLYNNKTDFETARLALTNIEKVGKNMHQTLKDLHQILKVGSSKDLPKEAVDISLLIEKEKQGLHNLILEKGASIEAEISVPIIVYPKVYLESILHNFLSNALKYSSPERKPVIKIQTFEHKDKVALKITDNGLGIDLAKHGQKLFGLYKTFHQKADSRGLGLYLVKKQVESLEGEIGVDSQVGKGTSFCILLPKWRKDIP